MRIRRTIEKATRQRECAFMPYVCAGYPSERTCLDIVDALVSAGADVIEFGLPFSDPIADGPTIQRASQKALTGGMNTRKYFALCRRIAKKHGIPLVAMTYYNLVLQYGLTDFARECKSSGVHGVIVPDLPIEESTALASACKRSGIDLIFLVAPTTDDVRLRAIIKKASGFVYLVSVRGVTGARKNLGSEVGELISRVKKKTRLPVCVGFGISTPEHARKAREFGADGVIVGSALIDVVERNLRDRRRMLERISDFAAAMKKACLG